MFGQISRTHIGAMLLSLLLTGAASAEPWQIAQSSGPVWFGADAAQLVSLGSNTDVPGGNMLVTGVDGRAMLVRGAQTMLVGPNSVVTVPDEDKGGITTILQRAGEVTFDVDHQDVQHFAVETPFLAAVVKGTHFTVSLDGNNAEVVVERGLVEVMDLATGERVDTAAGQHAAVRGQGAKLAIGGSGVFAAVLQGSPRAPQVSPISGDELQSLQERARNTSRTGLQEVRTEGAGLAVVAGNNGGNGGGGPAGPSASGGTGGDGSVVIAGGDSQNSAASGAKPYGGVALGSGRVAKPEGISPFTFALAAALLTLLALGLAYIRGTVLK